MPNERQIRRYTAYFRGWATAFGNHEKVKDEANSLVWLFGSDQVGLILDDTARHVLYPALLGRSHKEVARLQVGPGNVHVGDRDLPFTVEGNRAFDTLVALLRRPDDLHLFQTYHLIYPSGTRILTLGAHAPLPLIYREIAPLLVQLD
jgi:hypothetical protein